MLFSPVRFKGNRFHYWKYKYIYIYITFYTYIYILFRGHFFRRAEANGSLGMTPKLFMCVPRWLTARATASGPGALRGPWRPNASGRFGTMPPKIHRRLGLPAVCLKFTGMSLSIWFPSRMPLWLVDPLINLTL